MEAAVRVFADRLQQGSEPSSAERVYDDERSALRQLNDLEAVGLIRVKEKNKRSGVWTIEIVDPFEVGIGRLTRVGDEQAELDFGSCSIAHAEGSTEAGERPVAIATDVIEQPPSRPTSPEMAMLDRPPLATCVARSGDTSGELQLSNLSNPSKKLEPSNLSNLSEARLSAVRRERLEVREVGRETAVARSGDTSGEPKPVGATLAGAIDRLMPTAADRTREISGVLTFLRDVVGGDVRSERPLTAIAEAVCDRTFPQARLAEVCATYRREKKAGRMESVQIADDQRLVEFQFHVATRTEAAIVRQADLFR